MKKGFGDFMYINRKDFSMVNAPESEHAIEYKNGDIEFVYLEKDEIEKYYFECDEIIAPLISLLNRKGYKTKHCCSGHFSIRYGDSVRFGKLSSSGMEGYPYFVVEGWHPEFYILLKEFGFIHSIDIGYLYDGTEEDPILVKTTSVQISIVDFDERNPYNSYMTLINAFHDLYNYINDRFPLNDEVIQKIDSLIIEKV